MIQHKIKKKKIKKTRTKAPSDAHRDHREWDTLCTAPVQNSDKNTKGRPSCTNDEWFTRRFHHIESDFACGPQKGASRPVRAPRGAAGRQRSPTWGGSRDYREFVHAKRCTLSLCVFRRCEVGCVFLLSALFVSGNKIIWFIILQAWAWFSSHELIIVAMYEIWKKIWTFFVWRPQWAEFDQA